MPGSQQCMLPRTHISEEATTGGPPLVACAAVASEKLNDGQGVNDHTGPPDSKVPCQGRKVAPAHSGPRPGSSPLPIVSGALVGPHWESSGPHGGPLNRGQVFLTKCVTIWPLT